jgi:hypothetical protein
MIKRKPGLRLWVVAVLAWSLIRALIINNVFGKYGVSGVAYLAIDLISSIPYAICSGKALFAYLDKNNRQLLIQGALATIFFYLPDAYIVWSAHQVPSQTYFGLAIWLIVMSIFALIKISKG